MNSFLPDSAAGAASVRAGRTGRIFAIASGKGGVGKTWLAITLAHALARHGRKTLLFDADLGLANVDVQLGLTPEVDLGAVIAGHLRLADAVLHHDGAFDILPGRSGSGSLASLDAADLERMLAALEEAAETYDAVFLDLGAGIDRAVRRMAAFADTLVVIATEEPTSLTDAYAVLKLHAADTHGRGNACVVVNQVASRAAGERTYATLAGACAAFLGCRPPLAGVIRRDEHVRGAIRRQSLLLVRHPAAPAAADVEAIAASLLG